MKVVCDVQTASVTSEQVDTVSNPSSSNVPSSTVAYTYDTNHPYGLLFAQTTTGNDLGSTSTIEHAYNYIWNNNLSLANTPPNGSQNSPPTGTYIVDRQAFVATEDGNHNQQACTYTYYDNLTPGSNAGVFSQNTGLTTGLATRTDQYASCSSTGGTGLVTTKTVYTATGQLAATLDADAVAGITGHTGCTVSSTS